MGGERTLLSGRSRDSLSAMTIPTDSPASAEVLASLDHRHRESYAAFDKRDLAVYMDLFSAGLTWRGVDGRLIDFETLKRQVAHQFARGVERLSSSYSRDAVSADEAEIIETLTQTARIRLSAFAVVRREMTLERRGSYRWSFTAGVWRVVAVEIASERFSSHKWRLAWPWR